MGPITIIIFKMSFIKIISIMSYIFTEIPQMRYIGAIWAVKSNFMILPHCHPVRSAELHLFSDKFYVLYFCLEMSYKMEKCPILKDVLYFSKSCVRVLAIVQPALVQTMSSPCFNCYIVIYKKFCYKVTSVTKLFLN